MRRHNYRLWKYAIFSMLALISMMGFGFSLLSQNLTMTATTVGNNPSIDTWDIHFNGNYTATPLSTGASSVACGTPTINSTSVTLGSTHLSANGDGCRYALEVTNAGDVGGKVSTITPTISSGLSGLTCGIAASNTSLTRCNKSGDTSSAIWVFLSKNSNVATNLELGDYASQSLSLINETLSPSETKSVYMYVILTGTPQDTSFSGINFTYTLTYTQN